MTLREAIAEFLLACKADGLSPATVAWYKSLLGRFATWCETNEAPRRDPTAYHVAAFNQGVPGDYRPRCPLCHSQERQIKAGKMPSGSQRYKCQRCQKKYTPVIT